MQDSNHQSQDKKNKLYFGNLPFSMTEEKLTEIVSEFGEATDVKIITDYNTGRSKGFGFVEFTEESAAQAAIEALNETEVEGRTIFVRIAKPKAPRGDRPRGNRRHFGNRDNRDNRRDY